MTRLRSMQAAVVAATTAACIIPDRDIRLEVEEPDNRSTIRIVEPSPTTQEMVEICTRDPKETPKPDGSFCRQVSRSPVRSGLVGRNLCICPGGHDGNAVERFEIHAEDGDLDARSDGPYGVFLIDLDPDAASPESAIATPLWDPTRRPLAVDPPVAPTGREKVTHWEFRVGRRGRSRVDLCNDVGRPLDPGLHHLTFLVTDLPFFTPQELDADGNPLMKNGKPVYGNTQYGVPDLAAGATYDTVSYVFECLQGPDDPRCSCQEEPS